jgi:tRNA(Ile2) C34 agmatinyltransferase TiaS
MAKLRTKTPARRIKGTNKVVVKAASKAGMRKIVCPRCGSLLKPATGNKQEVYRCKCGHNYRSVKM